MIRRLYLPAFAAILLIGAALMFASSAVANDRPQAESKAVHATSKTDVRQPTAAASDMSAAKKAAKKSKAKKAKKSG